MFRLPFTNHIPRKWLISLLVIAFCVITLYSQISEGGIPPGFFYSHSLQNVITSVPIDFYLEDLQEMDEWQARIGTPMPVAKVIPVDFTMSNSGHFTQLPGGEKIWRLHIKANNAIALMLYYNDFYIPEGGKLFIYKPDKSQVLGAYTHRTHPSGGRFATEFVGGDELVLEYVASDTNEEQPRISINEIGYGYNAAALKTFFGITTYSYHGQSGNCEVNINCEEGLAWQYEKMGVCHVHQKIDKTTWMCTGALMNNTAEDFQPIILMASHCAYDGKTFASVEDMEQWVFYFNQEREECSNSSLVKLAGTMTGCSLLANIPLEKGSDGLLIKLKDHIPDNYNAYYNGWNRNDDPALSGVSIHHPSGDYKKISTYDQTLTSHTIRELNCDINAHWSVVFNATPNGFGITEAGSSGCPLFNENKLVVGTLTGGFDRSVPCDYPRDPNYYGKMSYHWNRYKTDSTTRMDVWLDPLNKGVSKLQGRFRIDLKPSPRNLQAVNLGQSISLSWAKPDYSITPTHYNVYRNNTKIGETTNLAYNDSKPSIGSLIYSVSAVYDNGEESGFAIASIVYNKYKAPSGLKAQRQNEASPQVNLSWEAPVYEQNDPTGFPEITKYRVYRSGSYCREVFPPNTSCTDNNYINSHYYEVSAFYGTVESDKSERAYITLVGNDNLSQTTLKAYFVNSVLKIESPDDELIVIYSALGEQRYSTYKNEPVITIPIPFQTGSVYVVKGSKSGTIKVIMSWGR